MIGGTPDLVYFCEDDKSEIKLHSSGKPCVGVVEWKTGALDEKLIKSFERGQYDNKLGAAYYQTNMYAFMLEVELNVHVEECTVYYCTADSVSSFCFPRADHATVLGWLSTALGRPCG